MKKILLINTGGTFSSVPGDDGLAPGLEIAEMAAIFGGFADALLQSMEFAALDSANIMPAHWQRLAELIDDKRGEVDGIVIIHGTDTMAYTASMLSFMCQGLAIPVVLTGSQLPVTAPLTDAVDNLRCAVAMAASGHAGVYVAFNRKVMLGCRTAKVRTVSFDAFESVNYPRIGTVNAFGLAIDAAHLPTPRMDAAFSPVYDDRIAVLKHFPGMSPRIFRSLMDEGIVGFFIEGFGLGGIPFEENSILEEIARASKAGIPVLVGSQCRYEGANLDVYETGQRVQDAGGISVGDMTQEATVTKLMWALGQDVSRAHVAAVFAENLCNEISI
ncbi:MAG: asparaginase [Peptococcaceae bacterium]|nr:asparaginase [Peptococcaceae bacterium]